MRIATNLLAATSCLFLLALASNANGATGSTGASLQVTQPSNESAPVVRGVRRESVTNETFVAAAGETTEIVFADGGSLTLASGASVLVETFSYDRAARMGELVARVERGTVRIVGGILNNSSVIRIVTPHGEARIDNGIAAVEVSDSGTDVTLLLGKSLSVASGGQTAEINLAGNTVRFNGTAIDGPNAVASRRATEMVAALNPGLNSGVTPIYVAEDSGEQTEDTSSVNALVATVRDIQPPGDAVTSGDGCGGCSLTSLLWQGPGGNSIDDVQGDLDGDEAAGWTQFLNGFSGTSIIYAPAAGGSYSQGVTENQRPLFGSSINFEDSYFDADLGQEQIVSVPCASTGCQYFFVYNLGDPEFQPPFGLRLVVGADASIFDEFDPLCGGSETCYRYAFSLDLSDDNLLSAFLNPSNVDPASGHLIPGVDGLGFGSPLGMEGVSGFVLRSGFTGGPSGSCGNDGAGGVICRQPDHFLLFDVRETDGDRAFLFASGQVTEPVLASDFTIDRFMVSPGVADFEDDDAYQTAITNCAAMGSGLDCAPSARAFLGQNTGNALYDSGLMVLTPAGGNASSLFHVDFGVNGSGAGQSSTISTLFGSLTYANNSATTANTSLVASTASNSPDDNREGLIAITTPIALTAVGGGNANIDGRAGYLVLENFGPGLDGSDLTGGVEHPVASDVAASDDRLFASTRLATGVGQVDPGSRGGFDFEGYLAGLQVSDSSDGAITEFTDSGFAISSDSMTGTVTASVASIGRNLGGNSYNSAYVDDTLFGAADSSDGAEPQEAGAAIVSGSGITDGWDGISGTLQTQVENYEYLQWGFFFGDSSAGRDGSSYAHLASWAAGKLTAAETATPLGSASYSGHVIGNVSSGENLYTAVGTFTNDWDFNLRQGEVEMEFDGSNYEGTTRFVGDEFNVQTGRFENLPGQSEENANFDGAISALDDDRFGQLQGSFVDDPNSDDTHVGMVGEFSISGSDYVASGTFAAEQE